MKHEQITVSVLLQDGGDPKTLRRSPLWSKAITVAAKELKKRKVSKFVRLELPSGTNNGLKAWIVVQDGIPYRVHLSIRTLAASGGLERPR